MSISAYQATITQQATYSKANSGYANTTAGPTNNSFSLSTSSGKGYFHQQPITNGSTFTVDFASGGNLDLVGDTVNFTALQTFWASPISGAVQLETYQSGGLTLPQFSTQSGYPSSGYGVLINPGSVLAFGNALSGQNPAVTAGVGNLVFRAVSGTCQLSLGAQGL